MKEVRLASSSPPPAKSNTAKPADTHQHRPSTPRTELEKRRESPNVATSLLTCFSPATSFFLPALLNFPNNLNKRNKLQMQFCSLFSPRLPQGAPGSYRIHYLVSSHPRTYITTTHTSRTGEHCPMPPLTSPKSKRHDLLLFLVLFHNVYGY